MIEDFIFNVMGSKEGTLKGMSGQNQCSKGYNVLTISSKFSYAKTAQIRVNGLSDRSLKELRTSD